MHSTLKYHCSCEGAGTREACFFFLVNIDTDVLSEEKAAVLDLTCENMSEPKGSIL